MSDLGKGYLAATFTSVCIALYTRRVFALSLRNLQGPSLTFANSSLNYLAGAIAGASNLLFMRHKELNDGILVQNKEGDVTYGQSKVAAQKAIGQTAFSRFFLPLPVLFFPAIGQLLLSKLSLWPTKRLYVAKVLELTLCALALTVALPMSVALFQQRGVITRDQIEEEIKESTKDLQPPVTEFYFNKGL